MDKRAERHNQDFEFLGLYEAKPKDKESILLHNAEKNSISYNYIQCNYAYDTIE